jgi:hypothetical protein
MDLTTVRIICVVVAVALGVLLFLRRRGHNPE